VGHDLDRKAARCFRLSRIVGAARATGRPGAFEPPADLDLISYVASWSGPIERTGRATVLARPGRAAGLRRWATEVGPGPDGDRLVVRYADPEFLAGQIVGYGADVRVIDPPEVREAVIQRLKEIAARHDAVTAGAAP
jgi:proteasome accessory factor B